LYFNFSYNVNFEKVNSLKKFLLCFLLIGKKYVIAIAIWDQDAILTLLSLYEVKISMLAHLKKKSKTWEVISTTKFWY